MKTTLLLNVKTKKLLEKLALKHEVSQNRIINHALTMYFRSEKLKKYTYRTTEYQKRCKKEEWSRFHVNFDGTVYEQLCDFCNVVKKSFSLLLALALNAMSKRQETQDLHREILYSDSYRLKAYTVVIKNEEKIFGVEYYWGIPEKETIQRLNL